MKSTRCDKQVEPLHAPAELERGKIKVDTAKVGSRKGMQLTARRRREAAGRLPVLRLCLQDQLYMGKLLRAMSLMPTPSNLG